MADNYLERHYEEYERRKAEWLKKKRYQKPHNTNTTTDKQS
ncbi:MAG: ABC transporter permease [Paludibacteraceae bacterium]|nr:ABC transporter permease [Paludibacteraceae bacterium]